MDGWRQRSEQGRHEGEPDIPPWAPLLYQLQVEGVQDKPDPLSLPVADRIRIGNQKRERGNFLFQREAYGMAARAYCMALDVLTTRTTGINYDEKTLLSEQGQYKEAMDMLKKALKLEPATKAIHVELSKLVQRQSGGKPVRDVRTKAMQLLGENITPFLIPSKKEPPGVAWKLLLGALVVALGSLVTSIVLTARN
ncbi:hypothetical protein CRUP_006157 [Coryphaenoides rupestris]|nr:hypothetical protein CRUP_006157 [Coryphaenoides rupestris]